jgi:alpha-beta hydrolase superfamily lysophospholipase
VSRHAVTGELVAGDGVRLFQRSWHPDGPPVAVVCLLHGLGEHCGRYGEVAAALNAIGAVVTAFDLRGHGNSPGKRGHASYEQILGDIDAVLDQAAANWPELPTFLYGNSLSGAVVLRHAQLRTPRIAGVVAVAPAFRPAFEPPAWKVRVARLLAGVWPSLTLGNELDLDALSRSAEVVAAYRADPLTHDRISARLGLDLLEYGAAALANATSIAVPTLVLHGTADRLTSCPASRQFAAAGGAQVELIELEGFFHEPQNDPGGAAVLEQIGAWISARISARASRPDTPPR